MAFIHEADRLIIRENPYESDTFDVVWKRREKLNDYRSRQKTTTVDNKLKSYDGKEVDGTGDTNKLKDKAIDYSFIDEYCKVSAAPRTRDTAESRPKELKTNTTEFGRPKVSFDKFVRGHLGGSAGSSECNPLTTTQPLAGGVQRASCQRVQGNASYNHNVVHNENTPLRDCYSQEEITLKCCGHNVETLVDYCTCMFCVKALFYGCIGDDDVLDNPCSCSPVNMSCAARWSVMGVLSIFLPCLMCYPLARGCTGVCKCYKEGESRRKSRQNRTVQNRERDRPT